jgi:hypothetical protein
LGGVTQTKLVEMLAAHCRRTETELSDPMNDKFMMN